VRGFVRKGITLVMATLTVASAAARADAQTPSPARARFVTDRGTVVLVEESHDLPLVDLVLVLRTGSAHDPPGQEGLARLTARMIRMGTRRMQPTAVEEAIDALGAQLTIETSPSYVRFEGSVIRRSLEPFLALLARLVSEPAFRAADVELVKRETVAAIIEGRDDDRGLAATHFRRFLFQGHPYGRPVIGTPTSVRSIGRDDVLASYRASYLASNVILGLAGDVTRVEAERLVNARFAALAPGTAAADEVPEPVAPVGRHVLIVDKPERTQTQVFIGSPGTLPSDADHFPLLVANTVFGGTFTARLMKAVRSERGWSYGAYSKLGVDRRRDAFSMWTFPAVRDAVPCVQLELDLLGALVERGITADELRFAVSYLTNSYAFEIDTAADRLGQRIDVEVLGLPSDYYERHLERIRGVTLEQANEALRRRLSTDNVVIVLVATASTVRDGLQALPGVSTVDVVAFDSE